MHDLNDLQYFAQVVAHGGFATAGRALDEPKSKLSRRIARLEARLGVQLIERSSRRFRVTEVGQAFYERCRSMLVEAELAEATASEGQTAPRGAVTVSCPPALLGAPFSSAIRELLTSQPGVKVRVLATNRRVDLLEERVDVALRVRTQLDEDPSLTMRALGSSRRILVCSPAVEARLGRVRAVDDLSRADTLSLGESLDRDRWELFGPKGTTDTLVHEPRLASLDPTFLCGAAIDGLGVALLPDHVTAQARAARKLVHLLPEWYAREGVLHLVFAAGRRLAPSVRALIDLLVARFAVPG